MSCNLPFRRSRNSRDHQNRQDYLESQGNDNPSYTVELSTSRDIEIQQQDAGAKEVEEVLDGHYDSVKAPSDKQAHQESQPLENGNARHSVLGYEEMNTSNSSENGERNIQTKEIPNNRKSECDAYESVTVLENNGSVQDSSENTGHASVADCVDKCDEEADKPAELKDDSGADSSPITYDGYDYATVNKQSTANMLTEL